MAEEDEGHGGALEPDEHGLLSEHAVAQAMAQISMLAAENDALRARNAELLREAIATSERAAQLEVEVRGGAHLDGEGEGSTAIEWVDMSARLQLLLTENSVLEADIVATKRALHVAEDGRAKAEEALAEALGATQRARASEEDALTRAAEAQMAVGTARDEAEAAQVDRAQETAKLEAALRELAASRAETAAAVAELGSMRRALDSMRTTAAAAARESEHQLALAADREAAHELRAAALERQLHNLEAVVADKEESVGLRSAELEEMAAQLASTHEQMRLAEAEAASAREEAARADEAAAEANERARVIGEKLERSTQLLERQVASAKAAAEVAARAHSAELAEARRLATETEAELRARAEASEARAEATRAQLSREGRERISLQREIEELRAVAERKERDAGEASIAGDAILRSKLEAMTKRADEATLLAQRSASEAAAARNEASRQRARAEGAELATEREALARRREVAAAEARRDAAREEAAAKGRIADGAMAEAQSVQERLAVEREGLRRWAEGEVARATKQREAAEEALRAALDASGGLQNLLAQQHELADSYREHALACTHQLEQLKASAALYGYPAAPQSKAGSPGTSMSALEVALGGGEELVGRLAEAVESGETGPQPIGQRLLAASLIVA